MNNKVFFKCLLVSLAMMLAVAACSSSGKSEDEAKPTIKLAQNNWLTSELNVAVAKILLEDEMGYPVEATLYDPGDMFPALESGDLHAVPEIWPSARVQEIKDYTERGAAENGGPLGVVGIQGWFMPRYVLDKYPMLATWKGLQDPELAALFRTPETGDKGQLLLVDPEWAVHGPELIKGLDLPFQDVYAGSEEAVIAAVDEAYGKQEPILFYFWTPHTIFAQYDLVIVELPKYSEGCADTEAETGSRDCSFPPDVLLKLFSADLSDYAPDAHQFLKNFKYTNEDQIMMLGLVEIQGKTVEEAARTWIEQNENVWRAWIP